jgi:hypothetical protein
MRYYRHHDFTFTDNPRTRNFVPERPMTSDYFNPRNAFVFNGVTGQVKQYLTGGGYRWVLRRIRDVWDVDIREQEDGGAVVDVRIDDYTILRETWGSYDLAKHRYVRWGRMHGFKVRMYGYYETLARMHELDSKH